VKKEPVKTRGVFRSSNLLYGVVFFSMINILLFNSFFASSLLICIVGVTIWWRVYTVFSNYYNSYSTLLLLFIPSFLCWASISYSKEAILSMCLGAILIIISKINFSYKVIYKYAIYMLLSLLSYYFIRDFHFYLLIVSFMISLTVLIKKNLYRLAFLTVLAGSMIVVLQTKAFNEYVSYADHLKSSSYNYTGPLRATLLKSNLETVEAIDIVIYSPLIISNILVRPWLWEKFSFTTTLMKVESLSILLLIIWFFLIRFSNAHHKNKLNFTLLLMITLSLFIFLSIGLSSANYGSISRYRSIYLPIFCTAILLLTERKKLNTDFRV
jgi:hypothetical protein